MMWWSQPRCETGQRLQMRARERQRQPEARGKTGATTTGYYAKLTANPNPSLIRDGNKAVPKRCVRVLYLRRRGNGGPAAWLGQERMGGSVSDSSVLRRWRFP